MKRQKFLSGTPPGHENLLRGGGDINWQQVVDAASHISVETRWNRPLYPAEPTTSLTQRNLCHVAQFEDWTADDAMLDASRTTRKRKNRRVHATNSHTTMIGNRLRGGQSRYSVRLKILGFSYTLTESKLTSLADWMQFEEDLRRNWRSRLSS